MVSVEFIGIAGYGTPASVGSQIPDKTDKQYALDFLLTLSGSYGTANSHGDPLDFTSAAPNNFALPEYAPWPVIIEELVQAGAAVPGFKYTYCPGPLLNASASASGPTPAGGVLNIAGTGAGSGQGATEITEASTYASQTPSLDGQKLRCRAYFSRT